MTKQEIINAVYPIVRDTQTSAEIADAILELQQDYDFAKKHYLTNLSKEEIDEIQKQRKYLPNKRH